MHVALLSNYNLYESKRYFCLKLAEAFNRIGIETSIIDFHTLKEQQAEFMRACKPEETLFTCSFNSIIPSADGRYIADYTGVPHVAFFVDPAFNYREVLKSQNTLITCVDHFDCEYVKSKQFQKVFFWAHAVERELGPAPHQERLYDVVFIGSCYDHENLKDYWRAHFNKVDVEIIESAIEKILSDNKTPLYQAVKDQILEHHLSFDQADELEQKIHDYAYFVDNYMRVNKRD